MSLSAYYARLVQRDPYHFRLLLDRKAISKERPRMGKNSVYTPPTTRAFEKYIKEAARTIMKPPATFPVSVTIKITDPIPKSYKGTKRLAAELGLITPPVGDLDNKVKAITDALNGVAYLDDKQICKHDDSRTYGDSYSIEVVIRRAGLSAYEIELFEKQENDRHINTSGDRVG